MKNKDYYIEKARKERGLSDEQITFFLEREPRWDLLPLYATCLKHGLFPSEAVEQVSELKKQVEYAKNIFG